MNVNNRNLLVLLLVSMVIIGILFPMAASASSWPSFQGNNYNNGVTSENITTTFATNWASQTAAGLFSGLDSGVVIDDNNVVYCVTYNGTVYAFNLTTGVQKWVNTNIANSNPYGYELSVPVYHDNHLYVGLSEGNSSQDTTIYALNATDGTVVWSNSDDNDLIPDHQLNTPIKYDSGKLYFGSVELDANYTTIGGYFYCVDASNGDVLWRYDSSTSGYYGTAPAIIGDYVVVGDDAGIVRSFNKTTGSLVDSLDTSAYGSIRSGIVYKGGNIYYTAKPGYLLKASISSSGILGNLNYAPLGTGVYSTSTPAVTDNYIYVGAYNGDYNNPVGTVQCFDTDLDFKSTSNVPNGFVQASPVVTTNTTGQERVYVTTNTYPGRCYWLTFNSAGEFTDSGYWEPTGSTYTLQGIAFANGWLVYGNDNGKLYGATGF